jgi:hypothetical protein
MTTWSADQIAVAASRDLAARIARVLREAARVAPQLNQQVDRLRACRAAVTQQGAQDAWKQALAREVVGHDD